MEAINYSIHLPDRNSTFSLWPCGDVHKGAVNHDARGFRRWRDRVVGEKFGYVIGVGDMIDAVNPHDAKRYSADGLPDAMLTGSPREIRKRLKDIAKYQADQFIEDFAPLKSKTIGLCLGNHERSLQKFHNYDVHAYICDTLGVEDLGFAAFINLHVTAGDPKWKLRRTYQILVTHGCQSGRTAGAKNNSLARLSNMFEADLVIQGHSHTPGKDTFVRTTCTLGKSPQIRERETGAINVGSFKNHYQKGTRTYEEEKLYNAPPRILHYVEFAPFAYRPGTKNELGSFDRGWMKIHEERR